MGRFSQKLFEIAGESKFTKIELERIYSSEEDQQTLIEVKEVLKNATNENEAIEKIQAIGEEAVRVLVRLGKKTLLS